MAICLCYRLLAGRLWLPWRGISPSEVKHLYWAFQEPPNRRKFVVNILVGCLWAAKQAVGRPRFRYLDM